METIESNNKGAKIWAYISKLSLIEKHELSRFLPLFFMKFLASFTYTALAATKDTVIVTAKGSGAEVIPILKGGVVIIVAFLFMLFYSKISNKLSRENVFYTTLAPFIIFFLFYGFYLYPNQSSLSFNQSADYLSSVLGDSHQHWVSVYRYWMNSLFFVVAEMWGGIMIGLLFWGFANQITTVKNAARFYAFYTAGGHLGTILAGSIVMKTARRHFEGNFADTISSLMLIASFAAFAIMAIYWWTNKYVLNSKESSCKSFNQKEKTSLSMLQSLKFIMKSPYLGHIAILVIGYGLSVNMVEVLWKAVLKLQYPQSSQYQEFMGMLQMYLGVASLVVALFIGSTVIKKFGWEKGAILPPVVLAVTSILFFVIYFLFPDFISAEKSQFLGLSFSPLLLLVVIGAIHNISCKSMKYCLFDPTKEMAYIPLDQESKVKGKAAVDLVGGRFGKSSASWIQLALIDFIGAGSILGVAGFLVPVVIISVFAWIMSVRILGKKFREISNDF